MPDLQTARAHIAEARRLVERPKRKVYAELDAATAALAADPAPSPVWALMRARVGENEYHYPAAGGGGTAYYDEDVKVGNYHSLRCQSPGGDAIARGLYFPGAGPGRETQGRAGAPGERRGISGMFRIPDPGAHVWTGILRLSYYQAFHATPWSVLELVLSGGELQVRSEDYPSPSGGGGANHLLVDQLGYPGGEWAHIEVVVDISRTDGHVEVWLNEQKSAEGDGPTITQPGEFTTAQWGMGTVKSAHVLHVAKPALAAGRLGRYD